ncbi:unnamed protein product, partial [Staurois parvus]
MTLGKKGLTSRAIKELNMSPPSVCVCTACCAFYCGSNCSHSLLKNQLDPLVTEQRSVRCTLTGPCSVTHTAGRWVPE